MTDRTHLFKPFDYYKWLLKALFAFVYQYLGATWLDFVPSFAALPCLFYAIAITLHEMQFGLNKSPAIADDI